MLGGTVRERRGCPILEFVPPGVWLKVSAARSLDPQAAIFLDRDGVIVHFSEAPSVVGLIRETGQNVNSDSMGLR